MLIWECVLKFWLGYGEGIFFCSERQRGGVGRGKGQGRAREGTDLNIFSRLFEVLEAVNQACPAQIYFIKLSRSRLENVSHVF